MLGHRPLPVLALLCLIAGAASAADDRPIVVNATVSAREIAFNQPVRIEFTSMPREIEGVDITTAVKNGLSVGPGQQWRLMGDPQIREQERVRPAAPSASSASDAPVAPPRQALKPINVIFTIMPRVTGEVPLPQVPMTWLVGQRLAEFGKVTVRNAISVGGEIRDLPKEADGLAGFPWGAKLADLIADGRLTEANLDRSLADRVIAKPQPGLTLTFRGGELAAGALLTTNLDLAQARASFLERWGIPQLEEIAGLTWVIGWTKIVASPSAEGDGVRLTFLREDIEQRLNQARVQSGVFGVLDGK